MSFFAQTKLNCYSQILLCQPLQLVSLSTVSAFSARQPQLTTHRSFISGMILSLSICRLIHVVVPTTTHLGDCSIPRDMARHSARIPLHLPCVKTPRRRASYL